MSSDVGMAPCCEDTSYQVSHKDAAHRESRACRDCTLLSAKPSMKAVISWSSRPLPVATKQLLRQLQFSC